MPLWFFPALLAFFAIVSLTAGIWLMLHLPDVARIFAGKRAGGIRSGPARRHASRFAVWLGILLFNGGWVACLLIWLFVIGGDANQIVDASR